MVFSLALLNSSLFYWFITVFSDCRHLNKREIEAMPLPKKKVFGKNNDLVKLNDLLSELMGNLKATSKASRKNNLSKKTPSTSLAWYSQPHDESAR